MPNDFLWCIRLLEILHIILRQLDIDRACAFISPPPTLATAPALTNQIFQIFQRRRAHDGRRHAGAGHDPRQRQLRHTAALLLRQRLDAADDRLHIFLRLAVHVDEDVRFAALRLLGERAGEAAASEGGPGDRADAVMLVEWVRILDTRKRGGGQWKGRTARLGNISRSSSR